MAILKIKDTKGEWIDIPALKGADGAIQYSAGYGINISADNVISSTIDPDMDIVVDSQPISGSKNPVASGGVFTALNNKADKSDIPTDTGDLKGNSAGFITEDDIPKDLGDFKNEAGFIQKETDPEFFKSAASGIQKENIDNWNKITDYTFVPIRIDTDVTASSLSNLNYTITNATIYNTILSYVTNIKNAVICIITNTKNILLCFHGTVNTDTQIHYDYWGTSPVDDEGHFAPIRFRITLNNSTGAHIKTMLSSLSVSYHNVLKKEVLYKTNTTSFTPTADYHPATKKYVDKTVADGVAGVGGVEVEVDPTVPDYVKAITPNDIERWNNKADVGGIETEVDPTVPEHVKRITEQNITDWNNRATTEYVDNAVSSSTPTIMEFEADSNLSYDDIITITDTTAHTDQLRAAFNTATSGVDPDLTLKIKFQNTTAVLHFQLETYTDEDCSFVAPIFNAFATDSLNNDYVEMWLNDDLVITMHLKIYDTLYNIVEHNSNASVPAYQSATTFRHVAPITSLDLARANTAHKTKVAINPHYQFDGSFDVFIANNRLHLKNILCSFGLFNTFAEDYNDLVEANPDSEEFVIAGKELEPVRGVYRYYDKYGREDIEEYSNNLLDAFLEGVQNNTPISLISPTTGQTLYAYVRMIPETNFLIEIVIKKNENTHLLNLGTPLGLLYFSECYLPIGEAPGLVVPTLNASDEVYYLNIYTQHGYNL